VVARWCSAGSDGKKLGGGRWVAFRQSLRLAGLVNLILIGVVWSLIKVYQRLVPGATRGDVLYGPGRENLVPAGLFGRRPRPFFRTPPPRSCLMGLISPGGLLRGKRPWVSSRTLAHCVNRRLVRRVLRLGLPRRRAGTTGAGGRWACSAPAIGVTMLAMKLLRLCRRHFGWWRRWCGRAGLVGRIAGNCGAVLATDVYAVERQATTTACYVKHRRKLCWG